tara:strand:- start:2985 stop:4148 length:1164 start_codon:yes stop_codon:yes gene_type:complete
MNWKEKALCLFALFLPLEQLLLYVFGIDTELKPYRIFLIFAFTLTFLDKSFIHYKLNFVFKSFLFIFLYGLLVGLLRISASKGEMSYLTNGATHFVIGMIIFYLISNIKNVKMLHRIGSYFISGIIISSLFGIYYYVLGVFDYRLRGGFNNPNHLAITINLITPFLIYKMKYTSKKKINLFIIFFLSTIVLFTGSRTGVLAQSINLLFLVYIMKKKIASILPGILVSMGIFYFYLTPYLNNKTSLLNRFESSNYKTGSGRFDIIDAAINLGVDTYFSGVGIGQYRFYHLDYVSANAYQTVLNYTLTTHNHYLDLLVNYSLLSLLIYFLILIIIKNNLNKIVIKDYRKIALLFFIIFIITSASQEMFIFPIFWVSVSLLTVKINQKLE